ncbi:MAG: AsmA family protein [Janthinobacterium lividum]
MRARRWVWAILSLLIVLPVAGAGIALAAFDPDAIKARLEALVLRQTGRTLSLNGPLRIGWSLWPTLEVNDVKLANLPGGSRPDMARAERIEAQISLPALLRHELEIVTLTLVGPNILFEQVGDQPNWEFQAAAAPGSTSKKSAAPASEHIPDAGPILRFRHVIVRNGMLTFRFPARTKVVGIRTLDFRKPTDTGKLSFSSVLVYSDYQPFSLKVAALPTGGLRDPWKTQLEFAAYDATASAKGMMDLGGAYDLQIAADVPALEKLNALLPQMNLPPLHRMTVATHLVNGPAHGDLPVIGQTRLRVGSADLQALVSGLTLGTVDISLADAGGLARVSSVGHLAKLGFAVSGSVGVPKYPDRKVGVPLDLVLRTPDLAGQDIGLKGQATLDALQFAGLDAAFVAHTPALSGLRSLVMPGLPALTNVSVTGRLAIPADIGSFSLNGASLAAAEADLGGDMVVGLGTARSLNGRLHGARLDLDAVLPATKAAPDGKAAPNDAGSTATGPVISDVPLSWDSLRGPAIDIAATIDVLTLRRQAWQDASLALTLKGGKLMVGRMHARLPDGQVDGSLTADGSTDHAPVTLALHAAGIPLVLVEREAGLPGPADGSLKIAADLHATGRSLHALAASLDGPVTVTMVGGRMSNAALTKLAGASLQALSIKVPAQGETMVRCLGLVGSFSKGIGRFDTIAIDTGYLQLSGDGQVDLGAETVALKLHPLAGLAGSRVVVPVLVTGPFRDIKGGLDANGFDKVGLLIDAWFGGDRPKTCLAAGLVPVR